MRRIAILALLLATAVGHAGETGDTLIRLELHGAVFRGGAQTDKDNKGIVSDLRLSGGEWQRAWAFTRNLCQGVWEGRVAKATLTDEAFDLDYTIFVGGDPWTKGGWGFYTVTMKKDEDGIYRGNYEGSFKNIPCKGVAVARPAPAFAVTGEAAKPLEHPRLHFRAADLPQLKERAATPFGEAALKKIEGTAAGQALRYQLTGDAAWAEKAKASTVALMKDTGSGDKMIRSRIWGWRLEQVALAYDWCYTAWDEAFRQEVQTYLANCAQRLFYSHGTFHKEINWAVHSTYVGTIYTGAGYCGLATWGEKGPAPTPPPANVSGQTIEPETAAPGEGVPVVKFASGETAGEWLFAGGFKPERGEDILAGIGGLAKARPVVGQEVTVGDRTAAFAPLPKGKNQGYFDYDKPASRRLDVTCATKRAYYSTSAFYTVIENDAERWVQVKPNPDGSMVLRVFLGGQEVVADDVVKLKPGKYPLLVQAFIEETSAWGKIMCRPQLIELPEDAAQKLLKHIARINAEKTARHAFDVAQYKALGGADPTALRMFELGRWVNYLYCREAVGTGGFTNGHPSTHEGPPRYQRAFETMHGVALSPYADQALYVPRKLFTMRFRDEGKPQVQSMGAGNPDFMVTCYSEKRDAAIDLMMAHLGVMPDAYKPLTTWALRRWSKAAGDDLKVLNAPGKPYQNYPDTHGLMAFLDWPIGAEDVPPAKQELPKTWVAPDAGWVGLRSGWEQEDEFIAQIFARSGNAGRGNAGSFRLLGLGREWCMGGGDRLYENVMQLPEDDIFPKGRGRIVHQALEPDGSGIVTIDLGDVYAGAKGGVYETYGGLRHPEALGDTGITGLRSIGVDYSGTSGAPCLVAIADRIDGGGEKVWWWPFTNGTFVPGKNKAAKELKASKKGKKMGYGAILKATEKECRAQVEGYKKSNEAFLKYQADRDGVFENLKIEGKVFTITRGDATLRGVVLGDRPVTLSTDDLDTMRMGAKCTLIFSVCSGLAAKGADEYFVVMTVQKGDPPEVMVKGTGLDAVVKIGERTARFDGRNVVFE